jgi:hypothetical protein
MTMIDRDMFESILAKDVFGRIIDDYEFICEGLRDAVRDEMELMVHLNDSEKEEYFRLKHKLVRLIEAAPMTEPFNETALGIDYDNLDNYQAQVNEVWNGNT